MTTTPDSSTQPSAPAASTAEPAHRPLPAWAKGLLFVVAPLLVVAVIVALIAALWPTPVRLDFSEPGTAQVAITVPNARIEVLPSGDGEVHVEVTGWYSGRAPDFTVRSSEEQTLVRGDCRVLLLSRCSLTVTVAVPASADVTIAGTTGNITASNLSGAIDIGTTNGALDITDTSGALSLRTTNGAIDVTRAMSLEVSAVTTNGQVELDFADAPTEVLARSTNGSIAVRVPTGSRYFIDARTTNGQILAGFESDRTAERTITAETTNGSIAVEYIAG